MPTGAMRPRVFTPLVEAEKAERGRRRPAIFLAFLPTEVGVFRRCIAAEGGFFHSDSSPRRRGRTSCDEVADAVITAVGGGIDGMHCSEIAGVRALFEFKPLGIGPTK